MRSALPLQDCPQRSWIVLQVVSIVGTEVFSLALSLTPTEGSSYADPTRSDGRLKLTLSCIQVVYLHKVFMSLLVGVEQASSSERGPGGPGLDRALRPSSH